MNKQRETIYAERDKVLRNEDLTETVRQFVDEEIEALVDSHLAGAPEEWDWDGLARELAQIGLDGDSLEPDDAGGARRPRGGPRAPPRGSRRHRSRRARRATAPRSGRRSSGSCCCARSTRCGWTT